MPLPLACTSVPLSGAQDRQETHNIVVSRHTLLKTSFLSICLVGIASIARADGVSAYLPLNLEPEVERQIERVLILAEEPILKRPIPVELVRLALPKACEVDAPLCKRVKHYLERYARDYGVTHASLEGSVTHGGNASNAVIPNGHGEPLNSNWDVSLVAFVQPNDHFLATLGGVAYDHRGTPTGTMLSFGFNWAQLDFGYRDHWFSPMTDTSIMFGTEAPTIPSFTLSNYEPLTRLGFQYELFLGQLSESDHIHYRGQNTVPVGRGNPKLFGAQFSIEPFSGWSLGVNRTLEYGGAGLPDSPSTLLRNFFKPSGLSQTQGNQEASYISRFVFPGKVPFALYFQYAGEDNSNGGSYLLGNPATSAGIDFPRLGRHFDATYEFSEWTNSWWTNSVFLDGMVNHGLVTGGWGGDQRFFNDNVGARSQMVRVGWEPPFDGYLEAKIRTLVNQNYSSYGYPYHHYLDVTLRYSRPLEELTVGGEISAGQDVYGKSFSRVSAFVRYGGDQYNGHESVAYDDDRPTSDQTTGTELFVDVGVEANQVRADLQKGYPLTKSSVAYGPHAAVGARRAVSANNDLGVRVEFDRVDGNNLIGLRPLDWRYRFGDHLALGLFGGVARYDLATPAYSIYFGASATWRDVLPHWDLSADFRHAQNIARDHVLVTDPGGPRIDSFYKIDLATVFVTRTF